MEGKSIIAICTLLATLSTPAMAQMDNVVEVETNYRPALKDADKINVSPKFEESTVNHYNVTYSSKAYSTDQFVFQPMWPATNPNLLRSEKKMFATFGYGTEGNVLGRLAGQIDLSRGNAIQIDYSTRGFNGEAEQLQEIKDKDEWTSRYYANRLSAAFVHQFSNNAELRIGGGYGADVFNYQPTYMKNSGKWEKGNIDTDKQHNDIYEGNISLSPYTFGKFAIGADASYRHFGQKYLTNMADKYSEDLIEAELSPEYDLGNGMKVDADLGFDYARYGMDGVDGHTAFDATPHFCYENSDIDLKAGVYVNSELEVAPDVEFTYHLNPEIDIYAVAAGGETKQDFRTFSQMSPYFMLAPGNAAGGLTGSEPIEMDNSFDQLRARAGVRINPVNGLYADISAGYDIRENVAELQNISNSCMNGGLLTNSVTFADSKLLYANLTLNYSYKDILTADLQGQYNKWDWDDGQTYTWRPVVDAHCRLSYRIINGLRIGADVLFQTFDTADQCYERPNTIDLGASVAYTFPFRLTLYAKGNNLIGNSHDHYLGYRSTGMNFLFGAAISF